MAGEREIPPAFRALFGGGTSTDEPAPPPPVDPDEGDGGDGHHHHFHLQITTPKLIVLSDGSVRTDGYGGTLLVGWCWLASAVTVWVLVQAAWHWLGYLGWGGFHAGLFGGALTAGLVLFVVVGAGIAIYQPTWVRRFVPVVLLVASAVLLGWVIDRWWMS